MFYKLKIIVVVASNGDGESTPVLQSPSTSLQAIDESPLCHQTVIVHGDRHS